MIASLPGADVDDDDDAAADDDDAVADDDAAAADDDDDDARTICSSGGCGVALGGRLRPAGAFADQRTCEQRAKSGVEVSSPPSACPGQATLGQEVTEGRW